MPHAIVPHVVLQHAEGAAFQWVLRDAAVSAPHYDCVDLAALDERVEAHLDGLLIAGEPGWRLVQQELEWKEAGEAFVATSLAFSSGDAGRIDRALEVVASESDLSRGAISALAWMTDAQEAKTLNRRLLDDERPAVRYVAVAAASVRREDPGVALAGALDHEDQKVQARGARAVAELGRVDLLASTKALRSHHDEVVRFWSTWAAALLGDATSATMLGALGPGNALRWRAVDLASRCMPLPETHAWHAELASSPEHLRLAIQGTGAAGDPERIPWLIEQMATPELARPAGEAFTMITGVDLAYDDLDGDWPEGFEAGPTENPEDEDVEMDPDEDLPWPDPELVGRWWSAHRSEYQPGRRYLLGRPIERQSLEHALRHGMQRQRAAAALELALLDPGKPLFEVRAPGFRQQKLLGLK